MTDEDRFNASGAVAYAALYWGAVILAAIWWGNRQAVAVALAGVACGFLCHAFAFRQTGSGLSSLFGLLANILAVCAALAMLPSWMAV